MRKNPDKKAVDNCLFRAVSIETDGIIYGKDLYCKKVNVDGKIISKCFLALDNKMNPFDEDDFEEVDIESVEENSGYIDGNGNPIFEGDYLDSNGVILKVFLEGGTYIAKSSTSSRAIRLELVLNDAIIANNCAHFYESMYSSVITIAGREE